jgi:ADP-ribose pyrophosphatase YjhB (NUDIX family)
MEMEMVIKPGKYRHSKSGKVYKIVGFGKHSETLEDVVIYQPDYKSETKYWVRPAKMWEEEVLVEGIKRKRFEWVAAEPVLQVGVKAVIRNEEGKVLIVRRSLKKYPEIKGRWDIVGGRINTDSGLVKNLQREIKEETGLEIGNEVKLIAAQEIRRSPEKYVVRLTYLADVKGKAEVKLDGNENDKFEWLSLAELKKKRDVDIYVKALLKNDSIDL